MAILYTDVFILYRIVGKTAAAVIGLIHGVVNLLAPCAVHRASLSETGQRVCGRDEGIERATCISSF